MESCIFCHGAIDLTTRRCQQCGQVQPAQLNEPTAPAAAGSAAATRRCPHCGADIPQWMSFCGYCGRTLPPLAGRVPDSGFPPPGTAHPPLPGARPEEQTDDPLRGSPPWNNIPAMMAPALTPSPLNAPGRAEPGVRPEPPKARPPAKRIIAVIGILVVSILSVLAVVQVSALLRRGTLGGPPAPPGQSTFTAGAHEQPTLAAGGPGTISEVPLPSNAGDLPSITAGPDGNLWFTEGSKKIGRITPQGVISEFPVSTTYDGPQIITAGSDGNLWFCEMSNQVGRITTGGIVTLITLPEGDELSPYGIAAGPDGNLWFTGTDKIVRVTPGGSIRAFPIPASPSGEPYLADAITTGPDGNLWFTYSIGNSIGKIGRITPQGAVTLLSLSTDVAAQVLTRGPDGNLWFANGQEVGRITPQGVVTEFPLPNGGGAVDIAAGPDGNLWFTNYNRTIGRITPGGKITTFQVPNTDSNPSAITAGPDGNMWFTDKGGSGQAPPMIGRVILGK